MMKKSLEKGRVKQKLKTRSTILRSAKKLMGRNQKVSLEDVADDAAVSRATIYRYYSNIELLLAEASLDVHHLSPEELIENVQGKPVIERLSYIQKYYNNLAVEQEVIFRRYLSAVLGELSSAKQNKRGARRKEAFKGALSPGDLPLSGNDRDNLINIACILSGIDAIITAKDVCGLDSKKAISTLEWGLNLMLKGLIAGDK